MIRTSIIGVDEGLCVLQGYVGAHILNTIQGAKVINPLNGAVCFGGIALAEKIFYPIICRSTHFLCITLEKKKIVSYGVATYATLKIMRIAGFILSVPNPVNVVGLVCIGAWILGCIKSILNAVAIDRQLQRHAESRTFNNQVFPFLFDGKTYRVRIICNNAKQLISFNGKGVGAWESKRISRDACILAYDEPIPDALESRIKRAFFNHTILKLTDEFEGLPPLQYTSNPIYEFLPGSLILKN